MTYRITANTLRAWPPVMFGLAALVLAAGCASQSNLNVICDPVVNDGLLLTVDLVQVNDMEAQQIQQLGEEWFYSDLRRQLAMRTRTVALEGNCKTTVTLSLHKDYDILAVIADYQFAPGDRSQSHMQFKNAKEWKKSTLDIKVHNAYLTVEKGR